LGRSSSRDVVGGCRVVEQGKRSDTIDKRGTANEEESKDQKAEEGVGNGYDFVEVGGGVVVFLSERESHTKVPRRRIKGVKGVVASTRQRDVAILRSTGLSARPPCPSFSAG
jgi:hypothetical protein